MTVFCLAVSWRVSWTSDPALDAGGLAFRGCLRGIAVYAAMCYALKVEEMSYIVRS
jgi:hypothetical protein